MNTIKGTLVDETGDKWKLNMQRAESVETTIGPITETPYRITLNEPTAEAVRAAIQASHDGYMEQYRSFVRDPGVNYPTREGWPESQHPKAKPVVLPPGTIEFGDEWLDLPAWVPLTCQTFGNTRLKFEYNYGGIRVLGTMQTHEGEQVLAFGAEISNLEIEGCIWLHGSMSDLRVERNHLMMGTRESVDDAILHRTYKPVSSFGEVHVDNPELKECMFRNNQIEGGRRGIDLRGPTRCRIEGNELLYNEVGIVATSATQLSVSGNVFTGDRLKYAGIVQGREIYLEGNRISQPEDGIGFWVESEQGDNLGDHMGYRNGKRSDSKMYTHVNPETTKLPLSAGGFKAGYSILSAEGGR